LSSGFDLDTFLESSEARGVSGASETERREIAVRLRDSLVALGVPLAKLGPHDVHAWLLHAVPEQFEPHDPLVPHVAPLVRALTRFAKLDRLTRELDETLPELEHALAHGHSHLAHDSDDVPQPYVRDTAKVGRNDPCPCGSGKKFKKCHGA